MRARIGHRPVIGFAGGTGTPGRRMPRRVRHVVVSMRTALDEKFILSNGSLAVFSFRCVSQHQARFRARCGKTGKGKESYWRPDVIPGFIDDRIPRRSPLHSTAPLIKP